MRPVEDPSSDCYECTAGMCSHDLCSGDQYHYNKDNYDPYEYETKEEREERLRLQFIIRLKYGKRKMEKREATKVTIINRLEGTNYC